jgi:hypothetical protein
MIELFHQKQGRREFLQSFWRYLILGGLVSTTGVLIAKRRSAPAAEEFIDLDVCRSCGFLKNCDLPKALLARERMTG